MKEEIISRNQLGNQIPELEAINSMRKVGDKQINEIKQTLKEINSKKKEIGNSLENKDIKQLIDDIIKNFEKLENTYKQFMENLEIKDKIYNNSEINVLNSDFDNDGVSNEKEMLDGTNPLKADNKEQDTDRDGISDFEEIKKGTNPYINENERERTRF